VAYTQSDIDAYREVLDTGSEEIAEKFLDLKHEDRLKESPQFNGNRSVVEFMKKSGLWLIKE
jgi:hypothetical protein